MKQIDKLLTLRNVLIFGLLISIGVTMSEVLRDKQFNFYIFQLSTIDFWNGIMPYGDNWFRHGFDFFLYPPTFNVIFAPFAYLPWHVGEFAWNILNYTLLALSIYTFPRLDNPTKARVILYLLPIFAASQLSFQYNVSVAYMFIFAFTLLERGHGVWAVLIIMLSATTKVYGLAELALLIFYPRFWQNAAWAIVFGALFTLLPLIKIDFNQLGEYYRAWTTALSTHKATRSWQTFYDMRIFDWGALRYTMMPYIQVGVFALMSVMVLLRKRLWSSFEFRMGCLAGIMGWCVLFGNSSETHTYLISLCGYLLWYWSVAKRSLLLKTLYWAVLVVLVLVPVDLFCPASIMRYMFHTLDLNKWLFLVSWCTMLYYTFYPSKQKNRIVVTTQE